jgi:hypothetical protein
MVLMLANAVLFPAFDVVTNRVKPGTFSRSQTVYQRFKIGSIGLPASSSNQGSLRSSAAVGLSSGSQASIRRTKLMNLALSLSFTIGVSLCKLKLSPGINSGYLKDPGKQLAQHLTRRITLR